MALSKNEAISFFNQALEEEIGIAIKTDDQTALRQFLYKCRRDFGDPELNRIVVFAPNGDELFLCKRETELDA